MAVMQTPHGRVIGLILQKGDQPKAEASEKAPETEAKVEAKPATAKKAGAAGSGASSPTSR